MQPLDGGGAGRSRQVQVVGIQLLAYKRLPA